MEHLLQSISCYLERLVEIAEEARREAKGDNLVTRCDLNAMEARLTALIHAGKDLSAEDKAALAELNAMAALRVRKLEALDARTPPIK